METGIWERVPYSVYLCIFVWELRVFLRYIETVDKVYFLVFNRYVSMTIIEEAFRNRIMLGSRGAGGNLTCCYRFKGHDYRVGPYLWFNELL